MGLIEVRRERVGDEIAIAQVNDAAFGQSEESDIIDAIRRAGHSTISLVAIDRTSIVGHILFTPVSLELSEPAIAAMGLGPMAVLPSRQRRGIGSRLVGEGLRECSRAGCQLVVVVGHPAFYPRFGFHRGSAHGLRCEYPVPEDVFMVIELVPGSLNGRTGLVRYLDEFASA